MPVITPEDIEELTATVSDPEWDYLATLKSSLPARGRDIAASREALAEGDACLQRRFFDDEPVERLVRDRARLVDLLLLNAWHAHLAEHAKIGRASCRESG